MPKFGGFLSTTATPAYENYFAVVGPYLSASETIVQVGTYQMRWAGHLYIDLHAQMQWPGTNTLGDGAATWLSVWSGSTPAPGSYADLGCWADAAGIFNAEQELRTHGAWYNLAAGATVTAYARLWTNVATGQVLCRYLGGNFRPTAI